MNREPVPSIGAVSVEAMAGLDLSLLTPTERQVLALALTGRFVRAIAGELVVSEATVHSHLTHIYRKLGVRTRLDLLALAARTTSQATSGPAPAPSPVVPAGPLGTTVALTLVGALLLLGLALPWSMFVSGPLLLAGGTAAWRAGWPAIRGASAPLLAGGLLVVLLLLLGALLPVRAV